MKLFFYAFLFFSLTITSCKKDAVEPENDDVENTSSNVTTEAILIQTEDENGAVLSGVEIKLGGEVKTSDVNGVIQFSSISLPSENATITVSKDGYFKNHYVINPSSSENISVIVTLAAATSTSINASAGGQVQCGSGAYIVFPANGFLDQNGSVYTGNVSVLSKYVDPSTSVDNKIIPNSFTGIDESNATVFAENHGMIIAEIYDDNGNELSVNPANKAELHIPVIPTDIGSAPNELPLYYFNESAGVWIEEGVANLETNEYVGLVEHFTFWMCPYVYDHHSLSGSFSCDGTPYSGAVVNVYNQYGHFLGSRTTNVVGSFSGSIPGTLTHTLEVEDPCGDVLYSESIGPFSSATNLGDIDVCSGGTVNYGIVEATLTDCNSNTDPDAYLNVQFDGKIRYFPANSSGTFSQLIVFCNSTTDATIIGVNPSTNLSSQPSVLPVSPLMSYGNQLVCNLPDQYVSYTLNGENYFIVDTPEINFYARLNISSPGNSLIMIADTVNNGPNNNLLQHLRLVDFGPAPGQYLIPGGSTLFGYVFGGYNGSQGSNFPVEITYIGTGQGDYIEGEIIGSQTFVEGFGENITVGPAQFRVKIDDYIP